MNPQRAKHGTARSCHVQLAVQEARRVPATRLPGVGVRDGMRPATGRPSHGGTSQTGGVLVNKLLTAPVLGRH